MSFKVLVTGSLSRLPRRLIELFALVKAGLLLLATGLVIERILRRRAEASLRQSEERMKLVTDGANLGKEVWDVTAQKQAEDRFRLVVEASPNGIVLVNERGQIVLVNAYAEKLFGYGREELIGQTIKILVPKRSHADHPHHWARFFAAPSARQMGAGRELFGRRKDGSEFPVEIGLNPIQSQGGMLVLAAIVDISARKLAEAEARQYREELSHRGRVEILGEMAGSLAHELNQPLTAIMNNASAGRRFIAKGRADMPKLEGLFKSIVADARRAGEIIHGIRNMLRKAEGARISVNLNSIIADVVSFVHSDAVERHCAVVTELDPGLPLVKDDTVVL